MKKFFYLFALIAFSLLFVQCEQQPCTCTPCPCVDNTCTCDSNTGDDSTKDESTGVEVGHAYVDLGLPSGLKWATCNVGATVSTDFGDYFAWGEVEPRKDYSWDTYKYGNVHGQLIKYCSQSDCGKDGFTDTKTILDSEDDAATVNWGGKWRMPTKEEMEELVENCTFLYTSKIDANGYAVFGCKVIGPNGNLIFLPMAGYMGEGAFYFAGSRGYFWTSSLYTDFPGSAYYLGLFSDSMSVYYYGMRYYGFSVRPVFP